MSVRVDKRVLVKMINETPRDIERFLDMESELMTNNIKLSFNTSPPGRTYQRGHVYHIASLPGFPPNVDTGALRASMWWQRKGRFVRWIMAGTDYAEHLEYGTTKMAPRPFMVPEAQRAYARLAEDMRNAGIFR